MNVDEILDEQAEDDPVFEFDDDEVEEAEAEEVAASGKRKSWARDRTPEYKRKRRGGDAKKKSKETPDPSPSKPFKSKKVLVHKLAKNSEGMLRNVCQNFVKPVLLSHIKKVEFANASNMMPLEQVFLGPEVSDILDKIHLKIDPNARPADVQAQAEQKRANDIKVFRLRCLDFYTTAAKELRDLAPL
ncbi:uncharacterized protein LOC127751371 [Frankliniella occidentalis]|uniref:Uncharacterized protein LOC127751371 n=1 Tax=Frankliniella occidentalis TaxID=133901 RepID=A0A9C6X7X6_FRAOC|nr:uncharacterized protein LOC127751371 [Frankliniella occidentalis]